MSSEVQARLITDKSNIKYLSNFTGSAGFLLMTKKKSYLFTDFRYLERAKKSVKKNIEVLDIKNWATILQKNKIQILGIEENNLTMERYKKFQKLSAKIKFKDISGNIAAIREVKNKVEIANTIKSQRINEKVFREIKKIIQKHFDQKNRTKLREIDLALRIRELGRFFGAEDVSFDPIVAFGAHTAFPHHEPGKTPLKKGTPILIDIGMKYQGYCSDMSRMIFTAEPTKKQKEIYNLVLKAQLTAIAGIKAGISGAKADALARDIINNAGYGNQYGHAGGHGVGLDIHEIPSLSEHYDKKLKENSIITIEPGIYIPGEFGVRIEDMLLVTKNGNKNFSKIKKELNCSLAC